MIQKLKDWWTTRKIDRFIAERDKAFLNSDVSWARKQLPPNTSEFEVVKAFHQARRLWTNCPEYLKRESTDWLIENKDKEHA